MKSFRQQPLKLLISAILLNGAATHLAIAQTQERDTDRHEEMERVVVTASPLDRTALESAQPIYVLSGDYLRQVQAATLGETLRDLPGVQSSYYSPTSSSPVIRGLDGPRVRILQNGLDVGDVSRGGPDHAVSTETTTAEQIEILRGPATLLYGSGASGGIVNVVDNRVPRQPVYGLEGSVSAGLGSAANERFASASLRQGNGTFALHLDGFTRDADDYRVPEFTDPDGDRGTLIGNSFTDDIGGTVGASYIGSRGFIGASYGRIEREYGIPGHSHDDGDDHDHDHSHDHDDADAHGVHADMVQDRVQLLGQLDSPWRGIERINLNAGYTELTHEEIEDDFVESAFATRQTELRLTARHQEIAGWRGAVGIQYKKDDYTSYGSEAFTPDTSTELSGAFWLIERQVGNITYELGARAEYVELKSDGLSGISYSPLSASAGFNYQLQDNLRLTSALSYSERAPQASELFSNGAHFATRTYEVGGIYDIHEAHDHDHDHDYEYHLAIRDRALNKEKSANLDLGAHYDGERFHIDLNLFYNRINDFIYARNTGILSGSLDTDAGIGHSDDHSHDHDHSHDYSGLYVYQYTQQNAELYGYEFSAHYLFSDEWKFGMYSDYTRAKLKGGDGNVPRIPAQRTGLDATYTQATWDARLAYTYYFAQNDVAENEAATDAFGILSAYVNFYPQTSGQHDIAFYLKAENLTNRLGYVHNSFIRDYAPLPGTNIGVGLRVTF